MNYINTFMLSLSCVAFSLSYFSIRSFALSLVLLIGLVFINNLKLLKIDVYFGILIAAGFGFISLISAFNGIYLNYFIKLLAMCCYCLLFVSAVRSSFFSDGQFRTSLNLFILIHVVFFVVQLTVYQASGVLLDFDSYVREGDSQVLAYTRALDHSIIRLRATGLFSEPSFYAMNVLPFSILNVVLLRKLTLVSAIGIATSALSLSVASLIICVALLPVLIIITKENWKRFLILMFLIVIGILILPDIINFIRMRLVEGVDYDAITFRLKVIEEFKLRGLLPNLLGNGFLWDERERLGVTGMVGANVRDSGFYVYTFFTSGAFGLISFLLLISITLRKQPLLLYTIACILLFKFHVINGTFWLLFTYSYLVYQEGARDFCRSRFIEKM
jgi:hypothetical protein